jgi:BASS family bile acid:Na+ symporter
MAKLIERYFWLCLLVAVALGLTLPAFGMHLTFLLLPAWMLVMFLTCLKVDVADVIRHMRQPVFIAYVVGFDMVLVPVATYLVARALVDQELAMGLFLLAAMPAGVASAFFTDLARGNVSLALVISLVTTLLGPFTVAGLLPLLTGTSVHLDLAHLFVTLLLFSFVPFLASQLVRRTATAAVSRTQSAYSSIRVLAMSLVVYTVIATAATEIVSDPLALMPQLLLLYALFVGLHIAGYMMAPWRNGEDRIALSATKSYMNNGLAIVLAYAFFTPRVALMMVLSQAPWYTLLGPFKYVAGRHAGGAARIPSEE